MVFQRTILALLVSFSLAGCVELVAAGAGAGVAYSLTADSLSSDFTLTKVRAVEIAVSSIKGMDGTITHTSIRTGVVRGLVDGSSVLITAREIKDSADVRVSVTSRGATGTLPDRRTATRVFVRFVREAR